MSSLKSTRRQVTLYVPSPENASLEFVRQQFNPVQFGLIASHVTLCRDEDNPDWVTLQSRAENMRRLEIELCFGEPIREGNLVYLPAVGNTEAFEELRALILDDSHCRKQDPHITLVHPRNGTCSAKEFAEICSLVDAPLSITFRQLTFIEQNDGARWRDLRTLPEYSS